MNQKLRKGLLFAAFGALLAALAPYSAFADNVYGTIRGTITDPTGAVVAGAQVIATNTQTGVSTKTTSQATGYFQFPQLPVGTYSVTVSKDGFKTFKSNGIPLAVNQIYELPVKVDVGSKSETIEVKADAVQVETTSIQKETNISAQQIVDLPLNGRNFTQLEQLAPGVMASNDRFGTFSVNGSQSQQSAYYINGTDSNDIPLNTPGFLPSPDAIQEFNLISSTINPEYGRNSGGIVNALIKSGTNQFHGDLFEFYRDTFLNSRNFFTVGDTVPPFHQNQFGGTIGGPVFKDRTFFFLSYQGTYNRTAAASLVSVFSPDERLGNFAADAVALSKGNVTPFPMVGDDGASHPANTPFFGTGLSGAIFNCGNAITSTVRTCSNPNFGKLGTGVFNSISLGLMNKFVPAPNATGNQFGFAAVSTSHTDQGIARIDHNFSESNQIWGVFAENNNRSTQGLPFTGATLPGFGTFSTANTKEVTLAYNHTFSSTSLNEFRLGWHRLNFDAVEPQQVVDPSSFGFTNIKVQNPKAAQLPVMAVSGLFTLGFSNNGPQPRKDSNYQVTDNYSKILGKHSLKFGFDGRRFQVDNPFFFLIDGNFGFNPAAGGISTGSSAADFLLGIPSSYAQGSGAVINARAYETYVYGQDQWKMRDNLTLTFGAGYQIDTPYHNNQFGGLAFNCFIPGQQSKVFPVGPPTASGNPTGAPVGMNFPGDPGCNNAGSNTKYGHVGPRFGFAYSPGWGGRLTNGHANKTSIRGGVGLYFNRYEEETALQNLAAPPFGLASGGIGDAGLQASLADPWTDVAGGGSIPNKFPFTAPAPGSPVDFTFFEPLGLNTIDKNLTTPYAMNFNLNIQRELPSNTVLEVGYVGSLGRHLYRAYEADPITVAGQALCKNDHNCALGNGRRFQHFFFPDHTLAGANTTQCPPFGGCFGSWGTQFTDGNSNYNSLQVNVTKGLTHGLHMTTAYTWSHSIDNGSGFENSGFGLRGTNNIVPGLNIGDSGQDARQRLVLSYDYQIPSLHNAFSWANDRIFGGWRITGITTFQTGFPVNIGTSSFSSLFCDGLTFYGCPDNPNQLNAIKTNLNPRNSTFTNAGVGKAQNNYWFDPNAFANVPNCQFVAGVLQNGNVCGQFGNVGRNTIHGPGINNFDFSLQKDTRITEKTSFQIGMDAFNLLNHTQFGQPNTNINSANFGRITTAAASRIYQIRAKVNF